MRKYRVFFNQINAQMVEIEASSPKAAANKAKRLVREWYAPELRCVEVDNHRLKQTKVYDADEL